MLQEPAVFHAFEVSRQVTNEAHSFREFIRFANISSGFPILVSHISPKANVLTLVAPHFSDRLPSENWMILDDNRQLAVVHPADRPFYLTRLSPDEIERLSLTESTSDPYEELWKGFFTAIAIKVVGMVLGILAMLEKDIFRMFPVLGIVLNSLTLIAGCVILYIGVR